MAFAEGLLTAAMREQDSMQSCEESETVEETVDDVDTSTEDRGSLYRWSTPCVLLLLETYKCIEQKLTSGKQSQKKTWQEVSKTMLQKGHNITGPQCSAKLGSLKKTYKAVKDHNIKSGNDRRTWQFFEVMDGIFAKTAWCAPVAVASSSGLSVKKDEAPNSDSGCAAEPSSRKSMVSSLLRKRLRQKEEYEEAKRKRHEERLKMDQKLLAIIEKLVDK